MAPSRWTGRLGRRRLRRLHPREPTAATSSAPPYAVAAELADEVASADALIFAVPLYNFGVSQHFKTWYDVVSTDPRLGPGTTSLAGRPAFLVTARGGGYGAGTPREGWDHATGWMRRVLEDVWGLDLDVIETELTLAEVTPQMADLRELAHSLLADSHETAQQRGLAHAAAAAGCLTDPGGTPSEEIPISPQPPPRNTEPAALP